MKKITAVIAIVLIMILTQSACVKKSRFSPTTPACEPDSFESDNTPDAAKEITINALAQSRNSHEACDADYARVLLAPGMDYMISADTVSADTEMWLYAADGTTQIGYDDDSGAGNGSVITLIAPAPGYYFIKVAQKNCASNFGLGTVYALRVTSIISSASATITRTHTITPTVTVTKTITQTYTVSNTSTQSFTRTMTFTRTNTRTVTPTRTMASTSTITQTHTNTPFVTATPTSTVTVTMTPFTPDMYEDDNTPAQARLVTVGSPAEQHNSNASCDYDWFKFSAVKNTQYTIGASIMGSKSAVEIYLYDTDGVTQLKSVSNNWAGYGTTLTWTAPDDGVYYVRLSQYSCAVNFGANTEYSISFTAGAAVFTPTNTPTVGGFPAPDVYENDDTSAAARTMIIGGAAEAHNSHNSCDADWYKFDATAGMQYLVSASIMGTNSWVNIVLYDTNAATLLVEKNSLTRGYGATLSWIAPADGTYYVKIQQVNCGTYYGTGTEYTVAFTGNNITATATRTLMPWQVMSPTFTQTPVTGAPDVYEDDDTPALARVVVPGGAAELHNSHDVCDFDWYKFTAQKNRQYTIQASIMGWNSAVYIAVYDTDGVKQLVLAVSYTRAYGSNVTWIAPNDGIYYIRIYQDRCDRYYGDGTEYTFTLNQAPDVFTPTFTPTAVLPPDIYEDDGSAAKARLVAVNSPGEAHNFHVSCDHDWFKFSALKNRLYTIEVTGAESRAAVNLYLKDTNGYNGLASVSNNYIYGSSVSLTWVAPEDGIYFLQAANNNCNFGSNAGYTIAFMESAAIMTPTATRTITQTFTAMATATVTNTMCPPDAYEDDDSAPQARQINPGGPVEGHTSHDVNDYDWIKFTAVKDTEYTVQITALGSSSAVMMYLFSADGYSVVKSAGSSANGSAVNLSWVAAYDGVYYVRISQYYAGSNYGANTEYTFSLAGQSVTVTPSNTAPATNTPTQQNTPTHTFTAIPYPPDPFENDDSAVYARFLTVGGAPEAHNSHDMCDADWFKFTAVRNFKYSISTSLMGTLSSTEIYLYGADGYSQLGSGGSYTDGMGYTLNWTAPADGVYFVKIMQSGCSYSSGAFGADTEYSVSITESIITMTPTATRTFTYTLTYTPTTGPNTPDLYEDDDTAALARMISAGGAPEERNSHDGCDYDWYKFTAVRYMQYTVKTGVMGSNSAMEITIYDTDSSTQLDNQYTSNHGYPTTIKWTAPADGVYYFRIRQYSCSNYYGNNTEYTVFFSDSGVTVTLTNTPTPTWTSTFTPVPTLTAVPDIYEDDGSAAKARAITIGGAPEAHNSHNACDYDWYKFTGQKNFEYTAQTTIMGSNSSVCIYVYAADGSTQLANLCPGVKGMGTTVSFTAPADGLYYFKISQNVCNTNYGENTEYTVSFTGSAITMTPTVAFTSTNTPTHTWSYTSTPTLTVTWTPYPADSYEDDDASFKARPVVFGGGIEQRNSHDYCDYDWYVFDAVMGFEYTVKTSIMGSKSAVAVDIISTDTYTLLATINGSAGNGVNMKWTAPADGRYYARIYQNGCSYNNNFGADTEYSVEFYLSSVTMTPTLTRTATYTPTLTQVPSSPSLPDAYEDDNTLMKAKIINAGAAAQAHNSHDACDPDWYKFTAVKSALYTFAVSALGIKSTVNLVIYDRDGYTQLATAYSSATGLPFLITWVAPSDGTYFIKVDQRTTCYSIFGSGTEYSIAFDSSAVTMTPSNTPTTVPPTFTRTASYTPTATPTVYPADAYEDDDTYYQARTAVIGGPGEARNTHDANDQDWYKFTVEKLKNYTVKTTMMGSRSSVNIYIYQSNGTTMLANAYNSTDGAGSVLNWVAPENGEYYVRISQNDYWSAYGIDTEYTVAFAASSDTMTHTATMTNTYTKTPTFTPTTAFPPDMYEDDGSAFKARMITAGGPPEEHNSNIPCDYDWYKFTAFSSVRYTVRTYIMGLNSATEIYILDKDGYTQLAAGATGSRGYGTTVSWTAPSDGVYYIKINQNNCFSYSGADTEYTMSLTASASTMTPTNTGTFTRTFTNTYTPTNTPTPVSTESPDLFETDDSAGLSVLLQPGGASQAHNFHDSCDYDWFRMDAVENMQYVVQTTLVGSRAAVSFVVYNGTTGSTIDSAYNYSPGSATSFTWSAPSSGTYYIRASNYSCSSYFGVNTAYTVSLVSLGITVTPTFTRTNTHTPTSTYTPAAAFPPDIYEDDGSAVKARSIVIGAPAESHNSHIQYDQDWFKFTALKSMQYTMTTSAMGTNSAVDIYVYDTDGYTLLTNVYSYTLGNPATLTWIAPAAGEYFVKVRQSSGYSSAGANTGYDISFTSPAYTMTPTLTRTPSFTPTLTNTPSLTPTPCQPDLYEDDNSAAKARTFVVGMPEIHTSHIRNDYDWYKFTAAAATHYTITTTAMGSNSAVYIQLYGTDGYTFLNSAYSSVRGTGTTLGWTAPADGTYYFKIYQYDPSNWFGANTNYTVGMTTP